MKKKVLSGSFATLCAVTAFTFVAGGCGMGGAGNSAPVASVPASTSPASSSLTGDIRIDGSSTVFPIGRALAQEFMGKNPGVKVTVAESGTGGGFKKFIAGEIEIATASRTIDEKEIAQLKEANIEFIEIPIAFDGLTVVVNPKNTWANSLTTAELKRIWEPGSTVKTWKDVNPIFPSSPIKFFSPGTDSGTFDYFTEAINGKKKEQRNDAQTSEDDNTLVTGIAGEVNSIGYFGYSYFEGNKDKVKAISIDNGNGAVAPSPESIQNNTYAPLSRPLFLYVSKKALDSNPAVKAIVEFFFSQGTGLIGEVGYVAFSAEDYAAVKSHFDTKQVGSVFAGKKTVGMSIQQILKGE